MNHQSKVTNEFLKISATNFANYFLQKIPNNNGKVLYKPISVVIDITDKCNLKCKHCSLWLNKPDGDVLSKDQIINILSSLQKWLGSFHLGFCGGEPFLREDLIEILKSAVNMGIITSVISNGVLLDKKLIEQLFSTGIFGITISLDGIYAKTHDFIRGVPGCFEKTKEAVMQLKEYKKIRPDIKTRITINTVIMEPNLDELVALVDWVSENELDDIWFASLGQNFGATVDDADWFNKNRLWVKSLDKLDRVINELIKRKESDAPINNSISNLKTIKDYFRHKDKRNMRTCKAGITTIGISLNGDLVLCPFREPVGNIIKMPINKIWNCDKARIERKHIKACNRVCGIRSCFHDKPLLDKIKRYSKILARLKT